MPVVEILEGFDGDFVKWSSGPDMTTARSSHRGDVLNRKLYLNGGFDKNGFMRTIASLFVAYIDGLNV